MYTKFCSENPNGRYNSESLGVGGKIILKLILKIGWKGADWMHVAQDRDQWRLL
jgi:hypothetical protein